MGAAEQVLAAGLDHGLVIGEIAGGIVAGALGIQHAGCSICGKGCTAVASCACVAAVGSAFGIAYSGLATVSST